MEKGEFIMSMIDMLNFGAYIIILSASIGVGLIIIASALSECKKLIKKREDK